jgi:hypothetical protein
MIHPQSNKASDKTSSDGETTKAIAASFEILDDVDFHGVAKFLGYSRQKWGPTLVLTLFLVLQLCCYLNLVSDNFQERQGISIIVNSVRGPLGRFPQIA